MEIFASPLPQTDLFQKRVFVQADLNVPLDKGQIVSDFRLQEILPTIDLILAKQGKIILATHIDRPQKYDPTLSTSNLVPWFEKKGYTITFESDLAKAHQKSFHDPKSILLLDNLRFYPGEKEKSESFAQQLAQLADFYVNDAFGTLARTDCSVLALPSLFSPEKRCYGLLIEKELRNAQKLLHPVRPYTVLIGGNKLSDKIPLIYSLIPKIDTLILLPAVVFSFLKAAGKNIGASLVDPVLFEECKKILALAAHHKVTVFFPLDYRVCTNDKKSELIVKDEHNFGKDDSGITIGPKTEQLLQKIILESKTIFYNGLMGFLDSPETLIGIKTIFTVMSQANGYSVIGGGDATAAAYGLGFKDKIGYLSTGGGALIAYLADQKMPALEILINK